MLLNIVSPKCRRIQIYDFRRLADDRSKETKLGNNINMLQVFMLISSEYLSDLIPSTPIEIVITNCRYDISLKTAKYHPKCRE